MKEGNLHFRKFPGLRILWELSRLLLLQSLRRTSSIKYPSAVIRERHFFRYWGPLRFSRSSHPSVWSWVIQISEGADFSNEHVMLLLSGSPRLGKVNVHIGASVSIPSEWKVNPPYGNLFVCITCILDTYTFHFPFRGKCKKGLPCQSWILKYSNYLKMTSFQDWHELFKWIKQE